MKRVKLYMVLVFSSAFLSACGNQGPAAQPETPASKQIQSESMDAKVPPIKGIVRGKEFRVEQATLDNNTLTLRQGEDFFADRSIDIVVFGRKSLENKTIIVGSQTSLDRPHLRLGLKNEDEDLPDEIMVLDGYEMNLAFGKATVTGIPFSIRLATKEIPRTDIEGESFATFRNIRLKNGKFDPTFDSLDTLRHLAESYLKNKYGDIELLQDFSTSYRSHGDASQTKSGFIGYEAINGGAPLIVRLQLLKGTNGWYVANQLGGNQIDQAHPLVRPAATDERSHQALRAKTTAATRLENDLKAQSLMANVRSTSVGCYTSRELDVASCRAIYGLKTSNEVACMSKNYLLVRSERNWEVKREINDTEKVDHHTGELVSYEPISINCS